MASGLSNPTAMQFAPDGRLFVCRAGRCAAGDQERRAAGDAVRLTRASTPSGERGLLGVAFDPELRDQPLRLRLLHDRDAPLHNRVSRFTANGDVAVAGSEMVLLELDNLSGAPTTTAAPCTSARTASSTSPWRQRRTATNAQSLNNLLARCCASTPTAPSPPTTRSSNDRGRHNRAIWALGLRNPFTFAFTRAAGPAMLINDVGQSAWEEINDGIAGANYGWPTSEGIVARSRRDHQSASTPTTNAASRLRHHRRRLLRPGRRALFPADYRRRLLLRRLLRRLDPPARHRRPTPSPPSPPASAAPST